MTCTNKSNIHPVGVVGTISAPCNRCIACRINKTEEWSTRLLFEAEGKRSAFITLTYDPEFLPENGSLVVKHIQDFNKRLRKYYFGSCRSDYKYYFCGEYGPTTWRPHYHGACIGVDFEPDEWICYKVDDKGKKHFTSPTLSKLWPFGFNEVDILNKTTMNYVTGYIQKKLYGPDAPYDDMGIIPPFQLFSRKLGVDTLMKNSVQYRENLFISVRGKRMPVSRYYSQKLCLNDIQTEDGIPVRSMLAFESEQKYKEKFNSEIEYAQHVIANRIQRRIDNEARAKLYNKRDKL